MPSTKAISVKALLALGGDRLMDLLEHHQADGGGISIPVNDIDELGDDDQQKIRNRLL